MIQALLLSQFSTARDIIQNKNARFNRKDPMTKLVAHFVAHSVQDTQ
jgi:hypothetical protein